MARHFLKKERIYAGLRLWARAYFVDMVELNEEVIRKYIQEQDQEDRRADQLEMFTEEEAAVLNSTLPIMTRFKATVKAGFFYNHWYPRQWLPIPTRVPTGTHPKLKRHLVKVQTMGRRLARRLFHEMLRYGPKLDKQQVLLGRFVGIGAELFACTAAVSYASDLMKKGTRSESELVPVVVYFCRESALRVRRLFDGVRHHTDPDGYKIAQQMLMAENS
mgnify:CR=1 FL=1